MSEPTILPEQVADGWTMSMEMFVSCPACAFTFDAGHVNDDGSGLYSCPNCAEEAAVARAEHAEKALDDLQEALGDYANAQQWMCACERCVAVREALAGTAAPAEPAEEKPRCPHCGAHPMFQHLHVVSGQAVCDACGLVVAGAAPAEEDGTDAGAMLDEIERKYPWIAGKDSAP